MSTVSAQPVATTTICQNFFSQDSTKPRSYQFLIDWKSVEGNDMYLLSSLTTTGTWLACLG